MTNASFWPFAGHPRYRTLTLAEAETLLSQLSAGTVATSPPEINWPVGMRWPVRAFTGVTLSSSHLASARIGSFWRRPDFARCMFTAVNFDGARLRYARFSDCTFNRCAFGGLLLTSLFRVVFKRCTFTQCSMASTILTRCEFSDCSLSDLKASRFIFRECRVTGTRFTGRLDGNFNDCRMTRCDLSAASVVELAVCGCALIDTQLPTAAPGLWIIPKRSR